MLIIQKEGQEVLLTKKGSAFNRGLSEVIRKGVVTFTSHNCIPPQTKRLHYNTNKVLINFELSEIILVESYTRDKFMVLET